MVEWFHFALRVGNTEFGLHRRVLEHSLAQATKTLVRDGFHIPEGPRMIHRGDGETFEPWVRIIAPNPLVARALYYMMDGKAVQTFTGGTYTLQAHNTTFKAELMDRERVHRLLDLQGRWSPEALRPVFPALEDGEWEAALPPTRCTEGATSREAAQEQQSAAAAACE